MAAVSSLIGNSGQLHNNIESVVSITGQDYSDGVLEPGETSYACEKAQDTSAAQSAARIIAYAEAGNAAEAYAIYNRDFSRGQIDYKVSSALTNACFRAGLFDKAFAVLDKMSGLSFSPEAIQRCTDSWRESNSNRDSRGTQK